MNKISVLGSTGSIGTQTLDVCRKHNISVISAAAMKNTRLLAEQAREFRMKRVCIYDKTLYNEMKLLLADTDTEILCGMEGLCSLAEESEAERIVNSVVGMVGLLPTLTAIEAGKDIALANKETLVAGGHLVMSAAKKRGVKIYPIDSEHSAIFQCLRGEKSEQLDSIILTASGGPFFGRTRKELENVTVEQALAHPNWTMGNKITIDSATLMNKGLEFIEAKWLFGLRPEQIRIVVHRQSVIHSAVELADGAVIAQLGVPDMKIPIQYALLYPERVECDTKRLSLTDYGTLTFAEPDYDTFSCLSACINAIKAGGDRPCIANGANEAAVALFLDRKIPFLKIGELVDGAVERIASYSVDSYEDICCADKAAREYVIKEVCR
ncbi:MAG: 1-deoxy-D-xylulose-5-phosphate reductoisomerase [Oscillospiraceae bacterium]|nr:1-deoxy-D-xylulose-5-phosphate reductoisomerase [Oscillospiraceae bacterium]